VPKAAGEHGTVVIVTAEPQLFSSAPAAEPLVEPGNDPSRLLADARVMVAERGTVGDVVVVARNGDPAEELLSAAHSVGADPIVVGRRGKSFVGAHADGLGRGAGGRARRGDVLVVA
jgi:nucleotide-binding universal stress UspA family protein